MSPQGKCAYCGLAAELTTEHASARWVPRKIPDSDSFAPVRDGHMCGGELTIEDVCASCNNVPLSQLDNYASEWWDRNLSSYVTALDADEPVLGRWLAKVAYNMQRIDARQHPGGREPPMPEDAVRWIIGAGPLNASLGIVVGRIPEEHLSASNAGHDGPNPDLSFPFPFRYTHLLSFVFVVVWRADTWKNVPVEAMVEVICKTMPGVALDLERGKGPRQVPEIANPDFVEAGFYGNPQLMARVVEFWRRQEARAKGSP